MQKKTLVVGLFLLAVFLFLGLVGMTAQAGIAVDGTAFKITVSAGHYDIDEIWANASNGMTHELWNKTGGVWQANFTIVVATDAILELKPNGSIGCTWLQLNSTNVSGKMASHIDVQGKLFVNDTIVTGYNVTTGHNDTVWDTNFRPYIYIVPVSLGDPAKAFFLNSTIGWLGYDNDNRYGIVYEENGEDGDAFGWMHNCTVMENFQGITFQGCDDMNVTDSYFNDTKESGITYTVGGNSGIGAHNGYIGDNRNTSLWDGTNDGVDIIDCSGDITAMGIRLCNSDNITLYDVTINNAYTDGLWIEDCDNIDADYVVCYLNTNAADDYNIYLYDTGNSTFNNCSAYNPDGAADGGNWMIAGDGTTNSNYNNFTDCMAYGSTAGVDFHNWKSHNNYFTNCNCSNSATGFYIEYGHNNTLTDCEAKTHVSYNYNLWGTQYNTVTNGYANSSAVGLLIADNDDSTISYHNTVSGLIINTATSYGVSIGTDGGTDNWCHNNTIYDVNIYGTTTGDGVFFFDNVTYNNVTGCFVTGLTHANACGFGISDDAHHNTFYNCLAHDNTNDGFTLMDTANNNWITDCTASSNGMGLTMSETRVHNNTIYNCYFHHNDWGLYQWPGASNANRDNYINDSRFYYCTQAGMDIGRIETNTYYNNTVHHCGNGIEVRQAANPSFILTDSYNNTGYDWILESDTNVTIQSNYILAYDRVTVVGTSTNTYTHAPGNGTWNLNTKPMSVTISAGTVNVNLTDYTDTYICFTGTAVAGDLTITVGGLRVDRVYELRYDGESDYRVTAATATTLDNTSGHVTFTFDEGWSTRTFGIHMITNEGNGGTPAEEDVPPDTGLDSDGDGWTDYQESLYGTDPTDPNSYPGAPLSFLGINVFYWVVAILILVTFIGIPIIMFFFPATWKKFKKYVGF